MDEFRFTEEFSCSRIPPRVAEPEDGRKDIITELGKMVDNKYPGYPSEAFRTAIKKRASLIIANDTNHDFVGEMLGEILSYLYTMPPYKDGIVAEYINDILIATRNMVRDEETISMLNNAINDIKEIIPTYYEQAKIGILGHIKDFSGMRKFRIATNEGTPPDVLEALSNDDATLARVGVAGNINTPPSILTKLSDDQSAVVRMTVAKNPNTPPEILEKLSRDRERIVRLELASNRNAPPNVLLELSHSPSIPILTAVALNPNSPTEALINIAKRPTRHLLATLIRRRYIGMPLPTEVFVEITKTLERIVAAESTKRPRR